MTLTNKTRNIVLSQEVKTCNSIFSKAKGFMFSLNTQQALVFTFPKAKIVPLHNFFVFFPLDVLFLDANKQVVEIKENFRPFAFYVPRKSAMYIIEMAHGVVEETKTTVGDVVSF